MSTSWPSIVATRSSCAKSPVLAGRSTVMSVPKRALQVRSSSVVDVLVGDLDGVDRELEPVVARGRSISGRTSTSTATLRSPREVLVAGPLDDVGLGAAERAELVLVDRLRGRTRRGPR